MKHLFGYIFLIRTLAYTNTASAQITNINGPSGSGQFGYSVTVLANGNFVVADPYYDEGAITDVGAVYLYNGTSYALISTLKGSSANDNIGSNGVLALGNGNFVVISTLWDNGAATNAGAVTFGNGVTGVSGVVSSSNSLVGSATNDNVGSGGVIDPIVIEGFRSGNYIIRSPLWDNGATANAGAVTWGNGNTGVSGVLNSSNSLVGSSADDNIGTMDIVSFGEPFTSLLIRSPEWDNGTVMNAGAVTWLNGITGKNGVISSSNSLVGSSSFDRVGEYNTTFILSNGNYVVSSPLWDNGSATDAGAVTWGSGTSGISGVISSANSLVGSATGNAVGGGTVLELANGNYIVVSPDWDNGAATTVGAVTWGNGMTGVKGVVSSSNSLVGATAFDNIGSLIPVILSNGNYVVRAPFWDNGAIVDAGSITWANGTTGISGPVSITNSLVGSSAQDYLGSIEGFMIPLNNGNYVIRSPYWANGTATNAGAVTWANGTAPITGTINSSNSLVGSSVNDHVGENVIVLANNNYVVNSALWANGAIAAVGAATWGNGNTGVTGTISSSNSLIGSTAGDAVGFNIKALNNGHYVVGSPYWDNGVATNAGAVTWCNGTTGTTGVVNSSNSLIGSSSNDLVGSAITLLNNGCYLTTDSSWNNGSAIDAGFVSWANGNGPVTGVINSANSLVGSSANDKIGSNLTLLSNGDIYAVYSSTWDNGALTNAGAVTIAKSINGITGVVGISNSLVGTTINDKISSGGVVSVNNNFVVLSPFWDNGTAVDLGAVTWINSAAVTIGAVSSTNSLVGSLSGDYVGNSGISVNNITNQNYLVKSPDWDNGAIANAGAVTFGNGSTGVFGIITTCNSVPGLIAAGGNTLVAAFNNTNDYIVVGKRMENLVVIYNPAGMTCANHSDIASTNINGTNKVPLIASGGCRIIASIKPGGANPVKGTLNSKVWIESSVPTINGVPFVSRHYEITPSTNSTTATGRVTLYFLQNEFNNFNAQAGSINDLPTGPADIIGKANLRIGKYSGTSSDGTGLPGTYSSGATIIDPDDADIVWNSVYNRWEVSFNVTGFSGFILQSKAVALQQNNMILFYPNPVTDKANLVITMANAEMLQLRIIDVAGRIIQQQQLNILVGSTTIPVDISRLAKGMYYLELKGETMNEKKQFVKQ